MIYIGNGVDPAYNVNVVPHSPGYPYLLSVSNRKPHKNEPRLLAAFASANIDPSIRLVMTGKPTEELLSQAKALGILGRLEFSGRVEESELPGLYRGALGLLFPSLYEGFGLPVIEAMSCGIPVLTSNTTSLPEVAGDAALLVDPDSVESITLGIDALCKDTALRQELCTRGLLQAAKFSWDETIRKVRTALDDI